MTSPTALDLVGSFRERHPNVRQFTLVEYTPAPPLPERIRRTEGQDTPSPAGGREGDFWETVARLDSPAERARLIREMTHHDAATERSHLVTIDADELSVETLRARCETLESGRVLGVSSRCRGDENHDVHLPLLDLSCLPTEANERFLRRAIKEIAPAGGALLLSGRSFHFYGSQLMTSEEWARFMGRSLLLHPFVDCRYVAHRLIAGYAVLRVSTNAQKPVVPHVVAWID